jgi:hypothetical protein
MASYFVRTKTYLHRQQGPYTSFSGAKLGMGVETVISDRVIKQLKSSFSGVYKIEK